MEGWDVSGRAGNSAESCLSLPIWAAALLSTVLKHSPKAGSVPMDLSQHPRFEARCSALLQLFLPAVLPAAHTLQAVDVLWIHPWIFPLPNKSEHAKDQVNVVGTSRQ